MYSTESGIFIDLRAYVSENTPLEIVFKLLFSSKTTFSSCVQQKKTPDPICETLAGITTDFILVSSKAELPRYFNLLSFSKSNFFNSAHTNASN